MSVSIEKLKVLDLFAGIGGFSLGLERTGGFETVMVCEIEKARHPVLKKHFPKAIIHEDVKTLNHKTISANGIQRIDVITGGFPCQDISVAGKRAGINEGTRSGLWSECLRLTSELRPKYAIFENVANLLSGPSEQRGGWFSRILCDLASIGYNAEWENIPAAAMGAPHLRQRVWITAYPPEERPPSLLQSIYYKKGFGEWEFNPSPLLLRAFSGDVRAADSYGIRKDDGFQAVMDRLSACGNAVVPQIPELIGHAILEARAR